MLHKSFSSRAPRCCAALLQTLLACVAAVLVRLQAGHGHPQVLCLAGYIQGMWHWFTCCSSTEVQYGNKVLRHDV